MDVFRRGAFISVLLFITACQTTLTQERLNAKPNVWMDDVIVLEGRRCQNEFGYKFGTPAFGNCMRQLEADRRASFSATLPFAMDLLNAGQPRPLGSPSPSFNSGFGNNATGGGQLSGQSVSGNNKYCTYKTWDNKITTVTIPRYQVCSQYQ